MSNHVHVVLRMEPDDTLQWSDEAVAKRWTNLFPSKVNGVTDIASDQQRIASILGNPERLAILRNRLGNLSWFMRCLSEPIARRANHEDECTGRFWEGRFKCQVLLDDRAVLACMAYVDLNPVRAKTAEHLIGSTHTSIRRRILTQTHYEAPLCAVAGKDSAHLFSLTQRDYIALVEWTGSQLHPNGRGHIYRSPPQLVQSWNDNTRWLAQVGGIESLYFRAIGSANALIELALALGQRRQQAVLGALHRSEHLCRELAPLGRQPRGRPRITPAASRPRAGVRCSRRTVFRGMRRSRLPRCSTRTSSSSRQMVGGCRGPSLAEWAIRPAPR